MSPRSRTRKPAKASQRRGPAARRPPASRGRLREPGLRPAYDEIIEAMRYLADPKQVRDAFDAEAMVSVLTGVVFEPAFLAGADSGIVTDAMLDVVDELARGGLPYACAGLRTLAVVGPPEVRGPAATAAGRICAGAEQAGNVPAWTGELGQVTPGACLVLEDPYGETQTLLCEFSYAGGARAHGVLAALDATWHGSVIALSIVDPPDRVRQQLGRQARRYGTTVEEIPGADAAARLEAGIEAFLRHGRPPGASPKDDTHSELCSSLGIARHRAAALAGRPGQPPAPADVAALWPEDAQRRAAEEFLASTYGGDLQGPVARKLPLLLIATCVGQLGCDPLLIGPLLLERILLDVLPQTLTGPDRFGDPIPPVLRAWTGWLADRSDLPRRHRRRLEIRLELLLNRFRVLWADPSANPLRRYVQDLPDEVACDGEAMSGVIERRTFAVPEPGNRGDGMVQPRGKDRERHADELDADDETDRALITLLGVSQRGLPQHRFDAYTAVTEQLWADDPAEARAAARRMLEAGHSREAILDRLADAWDKSAAQEADRYATALARLAPPRSR